MAEIKTTKKERQSLDAIGKEINKFELYIVKEDSSILKVHESFCVLDKKSIRQRSEEYQAYYYSNLSFIILLLLKTKNKMAYKVLDLIKTMQVPHIISVEASNL